MTSSTVSAMPDWERHFRALLPLFGHRNWIVVADSAYPAQSKPGIETIFAGQAHIHVVQRVLEAITACDHIRANVFVDKELAFVAENDAPGISEFRQQLNTALYGKRVNRIPHEQIIQKLDQSAQVFRILIVKTDMTIPYTSVFFELDCGYWNAEAEERLRQALLVADLK
ncbi:MAG: RbsD/FucU domain-containing protein [Terracidiphilus sp.]|jgi:L-fucose mutarotase/ribose pyranase (RbsD/FucU family)